MKLVSLYLLFVKISALTFGGGYAMVPLFRDEITVKHLLMSDVEFVNLLALAQVTPGPIGLNAATFIGMSQGGIAGAIVATLGVMTPSLVITIVVAVFLSRMTGNEHIECLMSCLRPCVVGIIASAVVFFADTSVFTSPVESILSGGSFGLEWQSSLIFLVALILLTKTKVGILPLLVACGVMGIAGKF